MRCAITIYLRILLPGVTPMTHPRVLWYVFSVIKYRWKLLTTQVESFGRRMPLTSYCTKVNAFRPTACLSPLKIHFVGEYQAAHPHTRDRWGVEDCLLVPKQEGTILP